MFTPDLIKEWKEFPLSYVEQSKYLGKFKEFCDAGAKILLGTDCRTQYVIPGFSIHRELKLLVENGMTTYEALKAGTFNAATCLETIDKRGTLEVGKDADMVMLGANPIEKIENSSAIEGVMIDGSWISAFKIDEILRNLAEERKPFKDKMDFK